MECCICEEPIDPKRLAAVPKTKVCIECAREADKAGKFPRHIMKSIPELSSIGEFESENLILIRSEGVG